MATNGAEWKLVRVLFVSAFLIAALYFAQDVFIPFALAALLSFLLSPLVTRLEHRGIRRLPAVLVVSVLTISSSIFFGWIMMNQFVDLAEKLPNYKENVEQKL